ncbi:hypothetical protein [Cellulomonas sp. PhB143]|uniref:hypothetical protein n=1 Tax=Cellulomonas sp. PhB143 TaxID=2485186 RepID=UPI000F49880A|nr:hypothetical protein [Cellulomonas sp. PhB143]ROS76735.1 hypothetical protein EDF32_1556 [Cellulomonas sp. PhB143]
MSDTRYQPLDGDPALLSAKARRYEEIADAIGRSTRTLDAISQQIDQRSLAMDATRSLADSVSGDIAKAERRYRETGVALADYASALERQKALSETAVTEISRLEGELQTAKDREASARWDHQLQELSVTATPEDVTASKTALTSATGDVGDAESALTAAQGRWEEAHEAKDTAAGTAITRISDVVDGEHVNGLEDSRWDKIKAVAGYLYEGFKILCDVAGVLAIFLAWVPGLGEALLVLAAIGTLLSVVESAVKLARGDIGWGSFLTTVALGAVSLFGGKLIAVGAKSIKARGVVRVAQRVGPTAARSRFGDELTTAYRTLSPGTKGRAASILRSPFVRSSAQKEAMETFQRSASKGAAARSALGSATKEAFPNPYKAVSDRLAGKGDVASALKFAAQNGDAMTRGSYVQLGAVTVGAVAKDANDLHRVVDSVDRAVAHGDQLGAATEGSKPVLKEWGGSYDAVPGGVNIVRDAIDLGVRVTR